MRVCVFGTRGFPLIQGGVEKHCELLYPLLNEDIELTVFRRKPYVSESPDYNHIKFVDLPSTKIKGIEAVIHSLLATLSSIRRRPDAVHIHNIGPALFAPLLKMFKIPVVLTYHSPNYEHNKWSSIGKKILLLSEHIALKCSDKIIFVNEYQMNKYPEKIRSKSVYIPNGIEKPSVPEGTNHLEEFGLTAGKYIISVGRITPEKGFDTLIKAYSKALPEGFKLVIAGSPEAETGYFEELKSLAADMDIVFTGYVYGERLAQLYANSALYVLASTNEGFPLVLLEAMSYGLDVLVSDIPATHLVELNDNDYFKVNDTDELAEKIKIKLNDVKGRSYNLEQFNWKKIANQVSDIYNEVIR